MRRKKQQACGISLAEWTVLRVCFRRVPAAKGYRPDQHDDYCVSALTFPRTRCPLVHRVPHWKTTIEQVVRAFPGVDGLREAQRPFGPCFFRRPNGTHAKLCGQGPRAEAEAARRLPARSCMQRPPNCNRRDALTLAMK
jgi:hypothetical protein